MGQTAHSHQEYAREACRALLVNNGISVADPTQLRDTLVFSITR